ncbi:hypothetical protein NE237_028285 [Protea cynaroides]|uniref:Wall-associated receptor kinase galacturonan-binding domain-containing protein n=1 Tax=Protea cynaroides TaxID=273540 RepID=A0A9Q0JV56_9MAGN|nr:hypothetical protein NE237_028285 [Protea cynaroides]
MVRPGFIIIFLAAFIVFCCEADEQKYYCNNHPSPCRNLLNISYPFRLKGDPPNCGDPRYELLCENNRTVLSMYFSPGKYYVEAISYEKKTMRVVDSGLLINNCSSLPLHSLTSLVNFTKASSPFYLITQEFPDVPDSCNIGMIFPIRLNLGYEAKHNRSFSDIHHDLAMGFELSWFHVDCDSCDKNGDDCRNTVDQFNNYIVKCWPKCREAGLFSSPSWRRKNVNPFANTSNQIYFPSWIYNKLTRGEDMEMEDATDEDKSKVRKMIIVTLSCIQLKPDDRPSMTRVIEMLESPNELLQMPPRPFLGSSLERMEEDQTIRFPSTTSLQSCSSSIYSEIQSNYI